MKRVVVTGIGLITSVGHTTEETWKALCQGQSGIRPITNFDASNYPVRFAGEVRDFDPSPYMDRKEIRRNDPFTHLAVGAAKQALEQAHLTITDEIAPQVGVCVGSGVGGLMTLHEQFEVLHTKGPARVSPFLIPMMMINSAAGAVSLLTGAKGPTWAAVSACATSGNALGEAWETIRRGAAKAMLAGGSERGITPLGIASFANMHALSRRNDDPQGASRPFDAERDGFVMGEGAGILLLEELDFALERGAPILAEMVGYGATADAYHITEPAPGGEGLVRAMQIALETANLRPEEVDYINAHGTSTRFNDATETQAIKTCFGDHAYKLAISSTKSMLGHTFGGAGAIEAAVCVLSIVSNMMHPTINLHTPDPECDLDYIPNVAREGKVHVALSNSMGFGGHNSSLIFRRYA
ncbi:3-oxoacyl-[acyl-carrier-protein] synthase II [Thermosporothrix hazakensis]|jgi:3-oxoacyl-[acyl-carrier-protein] synthase II|uniref:3-oxoacyl-[acyl-carrier-protein] synthase 2 n=1 Tax=Thermosporothrix hazakensis TaxID=644383 RepID=A0A326UFB2_THEHA|nr:beta-ketoacyl-ACP synthase II [Thermosporothrix hazakensis]PZW34394.1 3-oxoacyl-[acyl-carrier-protein] synthase II [Thermosporothrix hazakensis]GCE46056.1 3-oxoacyl-[acyl-carrier-protein] synthase 2 [Thermosporothrix hazakensis]